MNEETARGGVRGRDPDSAELSESWTATLGKETSDRTPSRVRPPKTSRLLNTLGGGARCFGRWKRKFEWRLGVFRQTKTLVLAPLVCESLAIALLAVGKPTVDWRKLPLQDLSLTGMGLPWASALAKGGSFNRTLLSLLELLKRLWLDPAELLEQ